MQTELKELDNGEATNKPISSVTFEKERFLKRGNLVLDLHTQRVLLNDEPLNTPPTSFDYLLVLARHSPDVVDYQTLVAEAQGYQTDLREAQELTKWHIHQLRQIIEADALDLNGCVLKT